MNNLSQNGKNKLVENIKNKIFHKIYVRTVFRGVTNGKIWVHLKRHTVITQKVTAMT